MHKLAYLTVALAACTTTESDDILTSGINAQITASTLGDGKTTVTATLFVGNPLNLNFVELAGDDRLVARQGTVAKPMIASELFNTVAHRAELAADAEGTLFEVAFERTIDSGAPSSKMTLPGKLEIAAGPTTASRAQPVTLAWSPSGSTDAMSWEAVGECIERAASTISGDPGTLTIDAAVLSKRMDPNTPERCLVTIAIRRSRAGQLDPHYGKGGSAAGVQERKLTFMSTP